jgi:nitrile hydratase accessory protein
MTTSSAPDLVLQAERLAALPLPRDDGGPVFAEPWQAEAFALAVTLSARGHFTWPEWAATLADELRAAAARGEPDDGTRYYEHWLAALERLVTTKGLTDPLVLQTRKDAWVDAYRHTPHGRPVALRPAPATAAARWLLIALPMLGAAYWLIRQAGGWSLVDGHGAVPQMRWLATAGLGSLLGMRHALEPDHLAAVSTLVTGERSSAKAAWLGACWGLGHTLTLLAAGAVLVASAAEMPAGAADVFELCVVLLLVGFGVRAIHQGVYRGPTGPTHSHAAPGRLPSSNFGGWSFARPLLVGAVHGLAGSGALTALVVTALPSTLTRLSYLALFGVGTTAGMAVLSGLVGWPLARVAAHPWVARGLSVAVGSVSTVLGAVWGYPLIARWLGD